MKQARNHQTPKTIARLAFLLCLAAGLVAAPALAQQQSESRGGERKTVQTVAMSQKVFEKLQEIQEFVETKQYGEAQEAINELLQRSGLTPYEIAQIQSHGLQLVPAGEFPRGDPGLPDPCGHRRATRRRQGLR